MGRSKKFFFYCLMAVLTLLVIEGMAQGAYYVAYGEFNGGGPAGSPAVGAAGGVVEEDHRLYWLQHPYYGYTHYDVNHLMNRLPPPRREDGMALIGLVGGSVGLGVADAFEGELKAWFRDNDIPLRPVVLGLAYDGMRQPQQMMQIANFLILGGEYDIIVNLDGYNDLVKPHENYWQGVNPFYPIGWHLYQRLTDGQQLVVGRIAVLRQRQRSLDAAAGARPWRWSALYGIVNRYLRERAGARILALNRELADDAPGKYSLQRLGPSWPLEPDDAMAPDAADLTRIALRVWYRSSVLLAGLSRDAGAEYYHFQQPNQYVPDSKPLTDRERADAYNPEYHSAEIYPGAYPLLLRLGDELRRQGVNYHDLTQIFADNRETLYNDACCHFNERGYELLAENMVQRMAPALRRLADRYAAGHPAASTALDAAMRERSAAHAVNKLYFDVQLNADGVLHYSRADCEFLPPPPPRDCLLHL